MESKRFESLTEDLRRIDVVTPSILARRRMMTAPYRIFAVVGLGASALIVGSVTIFSLILLAAVIIYTLLYVKKSQETWRKTEAFERDYPAFLLSLASAIKTGLDPLDAITMSYEMFPSTSPVHREAKRVQDAIHDGLREDEAIRKFGADIPHPDIRLFHDSFVIARQCGASIAPTLYRLAKFTRQRQSFRRKSRAAVAMQRLSSYGIMGCCVAIGTVQFIANPKSILLCFSTQMGMLLLAAGGILMFLGMMWMLHITKRRI